MGVFSPLFIGQAPPQPTTIPALPEIAACKPLPPVISVCPRGASGQAQRDLQEVEEATKFRSPKNLLLSVHKIQRFPSDMLERFSY